LRKARPGQDTVYKITPEAITESPLLSTSIQNSAHWIALGAKLTVLSNCPARPKRFRKLSLDSILNRR